MAVDDDAITSGSFVEQIGAAVPEVAPVVRSMRSRALLGAGVGLWVGLAAIAAMILLPRIQDGDFYEVGDPLLFLGVPALLLLSVMGIAAGAVLGIGRQPLSASTRSAARSLVVSGLLATAVLLIWGLDRS